MSAPAVALITLGSAAYLLIGAWMAVALGMLFALGGAVDRWTITIRTSQFLLCVAVLFLWAPLAIVFLIIALILAPFS